MDGKGTGGVWFNHPLASYHLVVCQSSYQPCTFVAGCFRLLVVPTTAVPGGEGGELIEALHTLRRECHMAMADAWCGWNGGQCSKGSYYDRKEMAGAKG